MSSRPNTQSQITEIPDLAAPRPSQRDKPVCQVDPKHFALATRMRTFVKAQGTLPSRQRLHWADALARMDRHLAKHGVIWEQIESVWEWYALTYPNAPKGLPALAHATQFRERWDWLLREMDRRGACATPSAQTEESQFLVAEIASLQWKPDTTGLEEAVQRSLVAVRAFVVRLSHPSVPIDLKPVRDVVLDELGSAQACVVAYFGDVHRRKNGWSGWSGNLLRSVWGVEQAEVSERLIAAVRRYTGSDWAWERLLKSLEAV